jgi:N-acetylmuramoyl-L-alanine amidase
MAFAAVFLCLSLALSISTWAASAIVELPAGQVSLKIVTVSRRSYLDAHAVAALVSGHLRINRRGRIASLHIGSDTLLFRLGEAELRVGSQVASLSAPAILYGRRFLVSPEVLPAALGSRFGKDAVRWNAERRVASIQAPQGRSPQGTITRIRVGIYPAYTRLVLEATGKLPWAIEEDKKGNLRITLPGGVLGPGIQRLELKRGILRAVRPYQAAGRSALTLVREHAHTAVRAFELTDPDRIVFDVLVLPPEEGNGVSPDHPGLPEEKRPSIVVRPGAPDSTTGKPKPPSPPPLDSGEDRPALRPPVTSPVEAAPVPIPGVLTVVLDPGHGGHDTGAIGPTGLMEKDVVLDLALRLRRLIQDRLGLRVILTREEDVFIPLPERTAIANRAKADFFISLHVNGSTRRGAVGFETFYFSREPSDNDARASAQRENLTIEGDAITGKDQASLLKMTLADMAVTRDMKESSELAEFALSSLDKILRVENRGVKSGPFYVLATAAMPAVLVESAFITNPKEERKLQQERYRQRIARALFEAIAKYKSRYERRVGVRGGPPAPGS